MSTGAALRDTDATTQDQAQQFVIFALGDLEYGIDIVAAREIRGWQPTTEIPKAAPHMIGMTNLRGEMVPNFDLRAMFGMGETIPTDSHVVVLVSVGARIVGILADGVSDILTIPSHQIRPVPQGAQQEGRAWLSGLTTANDRMVSILDLDALFADQALTDFPVPS